jgi:hypothetical protein
MSIRLITSKIAGLPPHLEQHLLASPIVAPNTSICSASPRSCILHPIIITNLLRKLDLAGTVVDDFLGVNVTVFTPDPCADGTEREDAFVSDQVVFFLLSETLDWRIFVAGGADEVRREVFACLTCCDEIGMGE